jgi:hypothetical protein
MAQNDFGEFELLPDKDLCESSSITIYETLFRRSSSSKPTESDLSGEEDTKTQDMMKELCRLWGGNTGDAATPMDIDDGGVSGPLHETSFLPNPRRFFRRFWIGISRRMIAAENDRRLLQSQELHRLQAFQN